MTYRKCGVLFSGLTGNALRPRPSGAPEIIHDKCYRAERGPAPFESFGSLR